jgi:hypothetical protein
MDDLRVAEIVATFWVDLYKSNAGNLAGIDKSIVDTIAQYLRNETNDQQCLIEMGKFVASRGNELSPRVQKMLNFIDNKMNNKMNVNKRSFNFGGGGDDISRTKLMLAIPACMVVIAYGAAVGGVTVGAVLPIAAIASWVVGKNIMKTVFDKWFYIAFFGWAFDRDKPKGGDQGGAAHRHPGLQKRNKSGGKWVSTGRKVPSVVHGRPPKTVYVNSATGEQRVRKMVARPNGTKRVSYVKF